jgi:hypothetical protein
MLCVHFNFATLPRGLYTAEPASWDFWGSLGHMHIRADGRFEVRMGRNKQSEPESEYPPDLDHFAKFADAVRTRKASLIESEIEETAISTGLCHLGNIAYRVKSELRFDPARLQFVGHDEANKLLTRDYRKRYVVPDKV